MYRYSRFSLFASRMARIIAHPAAFLITMIAVLAWLATGPLYKFSNTWQFVFSNVATIVTFVLLFLIQHTQSREMAAVQLKLNELIRATEGTHNALLDIEELTNRDYDQMKSGYTQLAQQAREQLRDGRVNWATARVQMEALDTMLDPEARNLEPDSEPEDAPMITAARPEKMASSVALPAWTPAEIAALRQLAQQANGAQSEPIPTSPVIANGKHTGQQGGEGAAVAEQAPSNNLAVTAPPVQREAPISDTPAILVIDDSEANRTLLKRRLEREGYLITTTESGQEGLDALAAQPFDMVLLDVMMAGMDGEQVLERMQAHPEWRDIPVIMITALDEQASVNRCLRLGARDYLLKPFDPVQLHAHIGAHLSR